MKSIWRSGASRREASARERNWKRGRMETKQRNSLEILKLIDELSLEAGFAQRVRQTIERPAAYHESRIRWSSMRRIGFVAVALSAVVVAVSAALFVSVYYPAGIDAQRQLARAQLISPL